MEKQVSQVFKGQKITDVRVREIRSELRELVDKAIDDSRNVEHEAREETICRYILKRISLLRRRRRKMIAKDIVETVGEEFPMHALADELQRMKDDRLVEWEGDLGPNTEITVIRH